MTPSVESIVPLPSWSMPRPPAGRVTGAAPPVRLTVYDPSAPPPCPTTLIAIVAIPACASEDATAHGAPFLESVKPWPKIATGQPVAGFAPAGMNSVNWMGFVLSGFGFPVLVPTGGMTLVAVW